MAFILGTFLSIYLLVHLYLVHKIRKAFPRLGYWSIPILILFGIMTFAPIAVRLLDSIHSSNIALALSPPAHSWMAMMLWFLTIAALTDFWNLALKALTRLVPSGKKLVLAPRPMLLATLLIIIAAAAWGLREASDIRVERVNLTLNNLPPGSAPIRLMQISDLHLGLFMRGRMLAHVIELIEKEQPDIVVSTGDLVDSSFHSDGFAQQLAELKPPMGKYAVLGNHEHYAGLAHSLRFHEEAGFRVLRGESVLVGGRLIIAGVDDPAGRNHGKPDVDEVVALDAAPGRMAAILLKHRPLIDKATIGRYDLQLSGHTHGGQIFPHSLLVRLVNGVGTGLHRIGANTSLYVSRGTGTWGPPMRLFVLPEITLITLSPPE
ncbi:MAG TPA: metallophosphoesterase [Planctomycetota bacterium]|nr:metallophosphoesterase [Planctomycetota bacterium]